MTVAKFAKEIEKETAEVVAILKDRGDEIKGSNTISDEQIEYVKSKLAPKKAEAPKAAPVEKSEAPKAAPEKKAEAPKADAPKKKPHIFISGMNVRPQGNKPQQPQGNKPVVKDNRPQGNNQNNNVRGYTPIKANVRTSASRLLDEDMRVKPQQPQQTQAPQKPKVQAQQAPAAETPVVKEQVATKPVANDTAKGVSNEKNNKFQNNNQRNKEAVQKPFGGSKPSSNMGGDSRRDNRPEKKTDVNNGNGQKKSGKSFGGSMMRQQNGNNNGYNNDRRNNNNSFDNSAAQPAPGNNDKRNRHDNKKNKEKNSQFEDGFRGKQGGKGQKVKMLEKPSEKVVEVKEEEKIKVIVIPEMITLKDLADKMKIQPAQIIKQLFLKGQMVTVNQSNILLKTILCHY